MAIIIGLLILYYVPNTIYMYNGEDLLMRSLIRKLTRCGLLLLIILGVLYLGELIRMTLELIGGFRNILIYESGTKSTLSSSMDNKINDGS